MLVSGKFEKVIVGAAFLLLAGCATYDVAMKASTMKLGPLTSTSGNEFSTKADAGDAFGLLKDQQRFPEERISETKLTGNSLELTGFTTTETDGSSVSVGDAWRSGFGELWEFSSARSTAKSNESRSQRIVWFKDIGSVQVQRLVLFTSAPNDSSDTYAKAKEGYVCVLRMKDTRTNSFFGASESDVRKIADAFAFMAGVPVQSTVGFPKAGFEIDPADGVIVAELIDGPADKVGIPLGDRLIGIDEPETQMNDLPTAVRNLGPGFHKLAVVSPAWLRPKTMQIFIPADSSATH